MKKRIIISSLTVIILGLVFMLVVLFQNKDDNYETIDVCKSDEVNSIHMTVQSSKLYPQMYNNSGVVEFDIYEKDNIEDIVQTCNNGMDGFGKDYDSVNSSSNARFNILIKLKSGKEEGYTIYGFGTEEQNRLFKVMMSEEAVRQVGEFFL